MTPPRFLLGLGLALWGSCVDVLWLGVLLGILVEVLLAAKLRLRFDVADFNRVTDLGTLLSLGAVGYFAATLGMSEGTLRAVVWLPVTVAPVLLTQLVSEAGRLTLRNLSYSLRKSELPEADRPVNIALPYFALCLVSASIAVNEYAKFLPVASLLIAYALFAVRARGRTVWAWAAALAVALALGNGTSVALNRLQLALEDLAFEWLSATDVDPYRAATRIGDVGRIKLSDAIVWRVRTEHPVRELLLFEAAYTIFDGSVWRAPFERFALLGVPEQRQTWALGAPAGRLEHIQVSGYSDGGNAILALPTGTRSVSNLAANAVSRNSLGSVRVTDAAPYLKFFVDYVPGVVLQPPPGPPDLDVPRQLQPLLEEARRQMGSPGGDAADRVSAVRRFFAERFRYSLYLGDRPGGKSLGDFLLESRSGHCEYFATATTLLLRSLGVPARYVVGYSVQEFSQLDHLYVVRKRHAHAWTEAYVDRTWVTVDTTPAVWAAAEAERASGPYTWVYDRISWLWAQFSEWRTGESEDTGSWLLIGALVACLWLYWRLFRRPRTKSPAAPNRAAAEPARTSAYFEAENALARAGYARRSGETPLAWLGRLAADRCPYVTDTLTALVDAHYRFAYEPNADRQAIERELRDLAARWRAETARRSRDA
jgi:transglutaminase-like putative cysteine protease